MIVRSEAETDYDAIRRINIDAFAEHPYSQQTEHLIVEALREADALTLSLVAEVDRTVVGHIAFSEATIGSATKGWFLLGPVAVAPEHQGEGIGSLLVSAGLEALRSSGASGCALVGDPAFYERFGFVQLPGVTCEGVPNENVLCLTISGALPTGELHHHPAFLTGL